ncbi:hypothetical protein PIB30_045103 [Stylosanthes scabra]|uniref:Uncharacterized protein n=1 Tax=Stylosanthes scabra TaxID=79078 RepID=A0ABU6ZET8_9FABA|nr:hypothetical protein [Stylosanthes scabra]
MGKHLLGVPMESQPSKLVGSRGSRNQYFDFDKLGEVETSDGHTAENSNTQYDETWQSKFFEDLFNFTIPYHISVVETKDGIVSVASAFAGHQEGNALHCLAIFLYMVDFLIHGNLIHW